jgi:hypothetical protein
MGSQVRRIKIYVGKRDIALGRKGAPYACPVARAIARNMPEATDVGVAGDVSYRLRTGTSDSKRIWTDTLPVRVIERIEAFDKGDGMTPFRFTLVVPE